MFLVRQKRRVVGQSVYTLFSAFLYDVNPVSEVGLLSAYT